MRIQKESCIINAKNNIYPLISTIAETTTPTTFSGNSAANTTNTFEEQLINTISLASVKKTPEEMEEQGRIDAENNNASSHFFDIGLNRIREDTVQAISGDDFAKQKITSRMEVIYNSTIADMDNAEKEKSDSESMNKDRALGECDRELVVKNDEKTAIKNEQYQKEEERKRINSEIKEIESDKANIEKEILVEKFWNVPTVIIIGLGSLLIGWLLLFFASSFWKITFEGDEIQTLLQQGITPPTPPIFDADAASKLFLQKGVFFGIIGVIFFIMPLLLSNIMLLVPTTKKWQHYLGKAFELTVGVLIIDVFVALLISQHTIEVKNMLEGINEPWTSSMALTSFHFWLVFIFGTLPLIITKMFIHLLASKYKKSQAAYIDKLRSYELKQLKSQLKKLATDLLRLDKDDKILADKMKVIEDKIVSINEKRLEVIAQFDGIIDSVKKEFEKNKRNIKDTYDRLVSTVDSGSREFVEHIIEPHLLSYKKGFFTYITSEFSKKRAEEQMEDLEDKYISFKKGVNDTKLAKKKEFNLLSTAIMFLLLLLPSIHCAAQKANNTVISYNNIVIYSDLSNRMQKEPLPNDKIIIKGFLDYFKNNCVQPGKKINDKSSITLAKLFNNDKGASCNETSIDLDDYPKLAEKQAFVNHGLDKALSDFGDQVDLIYKGNNNGGLDLLSFLYEKIKDSKHLKYSQTVSNGKDNTSYNYNNHANQGLNPSFIFNLLKL